ncbi:MAG: GGDEF domain-containing protein, partial [Pseudomonadota bacterium]
MTSSVDDDGTGPRRAAGLDALMIPAKSSTDSGFEAGLCVAVEAFPMASIVLESTGRIVASNRGAGPLLQRLKRPQVRSELDAAMAAAQQARSPIPFDLAWNEGPAIRFHITPLTAQSTTAAMLFLVTRDADIQVVGQPHQQGTLLSYECAPSPIRVLREEAARFKLLSEIDPLTGALNVRTFAAQVAQALTNTPRMKGAMICLDLDKFKIINDRYGHVAGDKVLIHVASKLSFPVHTGILTARMGGDEFALWVPGVVTDSLTSVIDCLRMRLSVPLD